MTRNDDILFSLKRVTLECWILLTRLQLAQRERKTRRGDAREDGDSGAAKGETLLEDERAVERGDEPVALQQEVVSKVVKRVSWRIRSNEAAVCIFI